MQRWEYLFVAAGYERDQWRVKFINGEERRDWKRGPTLYEFANQIGDQGWEIAGAPWTMSGTSLQAELQPRLFFKRPKP